MQIQHSESTPDFLSARCVVKQQRKEATPEHKTACQSVEHTEETVYKNGCYSFTVEATCLIKPSD